MRQHIIRWVRRILLVAPCVPAAIFAARLLADPAPSVTSLPADVPLQLAYLDAALEAGAAAQMQQLFPEGFFFQHALTGLAHVDAGLYDPVGSASRQAHRQRAIRALEALDSPAGRAAFAEAQSLPYGMFWQAWTAYLRAGIVLLEPGAADEHRASLRQQVELLLTDVERGLPYRTSYPGQAWPVDVYPGMVAVRVLAQLTDDRALHARLDAWIARTDSLRDPQLHVPIHQIDPQTGAPLDGPRATSLVLIARFLRDAEPTRGAELYSVLRTHFFTTQLSLPGVLEYPRGTVGPSDVDSGPLIAGVSLSASAVAAGTARIWGDEQTSRALLRVGEGFGLPLTWRGKKRYALGLIPVGDAFGVWSKTARPWLSEPTPRPSPPVFAWWRALWLGLVALVWLCSFGLLWLTEVVRPRLRPLRVGGEVKGVVPNE